MASYSDLATHLLGSSAFLDRVKLAAASKAKTIALEDADGLVASPRKAYAARFIAQADAEVSRLVPFVAIDNTIAGLTITSHDDVSDANINSALSDALWNKLAEALS